MNQVKTKNKTTIKSLAVLLMLTLVLLIAACANKTEEKNAMDKEQIEAVEKKVASLFNDDKTDLAENVSDELMEDVTNAIGEIDESDLSDENKKLFSALVKDKDLAFDLISLENRVKELADEEDKLDEKELETLKEQLDSFKDVSTYFKRNSKKLDEFASIVEEKKLVKKTDKAFDALYNDKGELKKNVSKEDLKDMKKLVGKIDDKDKSSKYEKKLKKLELELEQKEKKVSVDKNETSNNQAKKDNNSKTTEHKANQSNNASQSKGSSNNSKQVASNNNSSGKAASGGNSSSETATSNSGSSKGSTNSNNNTSKPPSKPETKPQPKPDPKPKEIKLGSVENSGREFNDHGEAERWANEQMWNENSKWYGYSWHSNVIFYGYKDGQGNFIETRKTYTIRFY